MPATLKAKARPAAKKPARSRAKKDSPRGAKPPAPVPVPPTEILGRAMLVNVCIGIWEGRKHDREVTTKVHDEYHATADAGRYNKNLFGGKVPEMSAIISALAGLRSTHYAQTLPWSDTGWRLLPTANYFEYTQAMRKARGRFDEAVDAFMLRFPTLVAEAQAKLGKMYRESDYPSVVKVRGRYHVDLEFAPVPAKGDFRVDLPAEELARMEHAVEDRVSKAVRLAMADAWERLGDAVAGLRDKLDDGKHLRGSMMKKLGTVAESLGRLNLTGDADLERVRLAVLKDLAGYDAETLRDNDTVRATAASAADAILKQMQSVYTPTQKEPG